MTEQTAKEQALAELIFNEANLLSDEVADQIIKLIADIGGRMTLPTQAEIRKRIEEIALKRGLNAQKLMKEYGVTTALAEMLEKKQGEVKE